MDEVHARTGGRGAIEIYGPRHDLFEFGLEARTEVNAMRDLGEVGRSVYVRGLIATRDPARHPEEALVFVDEQR